MTLSELYAFSRKVLSDAGNDSSSFDSMCLMRKFFNIDRQQLIVNGNLIPDSEKEKDFLTAVEKRAEGYPLQYIIGKWIFMDNEFYVGEGVLIPRDDTEVVVNTCIKALEKIRKPVIIDLCSGSGAIAVTLAKLYPDSTVYAVELSEQAFSYLEKNIENNKVENIIKIKDDIFSCYGNFLDNTFDIIISNPPYIESNTISSLQTEVQNEPVMALDGGKDGLDFYRVIAEKWVSKLKSGGSIALEIGEEQAESVSELLENNGIFDIEVIKDIQNLDRAVFGIKETE